MKILYTPVFTLVFILDSIELSPQPPNRGRIIKNVVYYNGQAIGIQIGEEIHPFKKDGHFVQHSGEFGVSRHPGDEYEYLSVGSQASRECIDEHCSHHTIIEHYDPTPPRDLPPRTTIVRQYSFPYNVQYITKDRNGTFYQMLTFYDAVVNEHYQIVGFFMDYDPELWPIYMNTDEGRVRVKLDEITQVPTHMKPPETTELYPENVRYIQPEGIYRDSIRRRG